MLSPLRGREAEIGVLTTALAASRERGTGAVVLIDGEAGAGKSRLLREFASLAEATGTDSRIGMADPFGHLAPLGAITEALAWSPNPILDRNSVTELVRTDTDRYWMLEELQEQLERAALDRARLIMVDDAQWCDALSLLALRTLLPRLAPHPIVWVVTRRTSNPGADLEITWSALIDHGATRLVLGQLQETAVREIASDILGMQPGASVLPYLADIGNNPFLLTELLNGIREEQAFAVVDGQAEMPRRVTPLRLRSAVRRRLDILPAEAQQLLFTASALGRRTEIAVLSELLDVSLDAAFAAAEAAIAASLVHFHHNDVEFRHDLIREMILDALRPETIRLVRRRAADVLLARGYDIADVGELLISSAEDQDVRAAELLREAAQRLAATAPVDAAVLSRRAVEISPPEEAGYNELLREAIRLNWVAGEFVAARRLSDRAIAAHRGGAGESSLRLEIAMLSTQYSFTEAARHCRAAVNVPGLPEAVAARVHAFFGLTLLNCGRVNEAASEVALGLEISERVGDVAALSLAVACNSTLTWYQLDLLGALTLCDDSIRIADRTPHGRDLWVPEIWKAMVLSSMGRDVEAIDLIDENLASARIARQTHLVYYWVTLRARILLDAGRLVDARAEAEAALAMAEELNAGDWTKATALYTLGRVALHTGTDARRHEADGWAMTMAQDEAPLIRRSGLWLLALSNYSTGRFYAAARMAAEGMDTVSAPEPSFATPHDPIDDVLAVRVAIAAGLNKRARSIAAVSSRRTELNPELHLVAVVSGHAWALINADVDALMRAADGYRLAGRRLAEANALEDAAARSAPANGGLARARFEAAHALYTTVGADHDAYRITGYLTFHRAEGADASVRKARPAPQQHAPPETRWRGLTPSEQRVAVHAAAGRTNREIAALLSLSPHTVDSHLRHTFGRLGIRSRVELARIMVNDPPSMPLS